MPQQIRKVMGNEKVCLIDHLTDLNNNTNPRGTGIDLSPQGIKY